MLIPFAVGGAAGFCNEPEPESLQEMLAAAMSANGESLADIVSCSLTEAQLEAGQPAWADLPDFEVRTSRSVYEPIAVACGRSCISRRPLATMPHAA